MPSERLNTFLSRIRALIKSRQLDRDLKDEIDFHLSMREQKNREAGMDAQEARYAARRHFGNITTLKEAARQLWTFVSLESIWQDVRFAVRMLQRNPAFTVVALLTLALGIGANTAIFSVAYHILLRPLPFSDAARLVMVWEDASSYGFPRDTPSPGNFASWKANNGVFSGMAAMDRQRFDLSGEGAPVQLLGEEISANMFPLLGVQPELGRNFLPEEDKPGAIHAVILSHSLWMANFGGSPQILGQQIWLNDFAKYTIVGVMPRFRFPRSRNANLDSPPPLGQRPREPRQPLLARDRSVKGRCFALTSQFRPRHHRTTPRHAVSGQQRKSRGLRHASSRSPHRQFPPRRNCPARGGRFRPLHCLRKYGQPSSRPRDWASERTPHAHGIGGEPRKDCTATSHREHAAFRSCWVHRLASRCVGHALPGVPHSRRTCSHQSLGPERRGPRVSVLRLAILRRSLRARSRAPYFASRYPFPDQGKHPGKRGSPVARCSCRLRSRAGLNLIIRLRVDGA